MKHNQRHRLGLMIAAVMCSLPVTAAEMVSVSDSAVLEQALSVQARSLAPVENGFEAVKTIQLPNGKPKFDISKPIWACLCLIPPLSRQKDAQG